MGTRAKSPAASTAAIAAIATAASLAMFSWCSTASAAADKPTALSDVQQKRAATARELFEQNNFVAALPLYEQLVRDDPTSASFAERFVVCAVGVLTTLAPGKDRDALILRAKAEAQRARSLGDDSNLLRTMQDALNGDMGGATTGGGEDMRAAEAAFAHGDLDGALSRYETIAAADPSSYEARLFAGDVYFRKGDLRLASEWFQKAIDVDPNRETAYRYWGDALAKAGDRRAALEKFTEAVIAEPYTRKAWMGLTQWAKAAGATVGIADIRLPAAPKETTTAAGKPGTTINIDPRYLDGAAGGKAQLAYSLTRSAWRELKFLVTFPGEKHYRHSLPEEVDAITAMMDALRDQAPPAELADLVPIYRDGLVSAYVLISRADDGIAQDYARYREEHRDLLRRYIREYLVHTASTPSKTEI